jgi:N-acetylneuraminic acid mutarotase
MYDAAMKRKPAYLSAFLICAVLVAPAFFSNVAAAEDSWVSMAQMPTARAQIGAAVVDGKIYVIGGVSGANEVYDPAAGTWETKTPMPHPRTSFGIAVCDGKIYVIGGYANTTTGGVPDMSGLVEAYDPAADSWETRASMLTPRGQLTASAVNGKIYTMGGFQDNRGTTSFLNEVYDPASDTWKTQQPLPNAAYGHSAVALGSKIYVIWGQTSGRPNGYLSGPWNQIYDTENNSWTLGAAPPEPVHRSGAVVTSGVDAPQRIYVVGGEVGFMQALNVIQIYDPQTDTWSRGTDMPTARQGLALAAVNDLLYAIGGCYPTNDYTIATSNSQNHRYTTLVAEASPANFVPQQNSAANERYTPIGYTGTEPPTPAPTEASPSGSDTQTNVLLILSVTVSAIVIGAGLAVYFKKYKHKPKQETK